MNKSGCVLFWLSHIGLDVEYDTLSLHFRCVRVYQLMSCKSEAVRLLHLDLDYVAERHSRYYWQAICSIGRKRHKIIYGVAFLNQSSQPDI